MGGQSRFKRASGGLAVVYVYYSQYKGFVAFMIQVL